MIELKQDWVFIIKQAVKTLTKMFKLKERLRITLFRLF